MEEEQEQFIAAQRAMWEEETEKRIAQLEEKWKVELAQAVEKIKCGGMPSPTLVTPANELNSGHRSCNPALEKVNQDANIDVGQNCVKKRLDLDGGLHSPCGEPRQEDEACEPRHDAEPRLPEIIDTVAPKRSTNNTLDLTSDDEECRLAVDTVDNIVAIGKVMNVQVEASIQLVHGVPLGEGNVRVTVIRAIEGDALVPIPMRDEILTVDDAIGSCVAWPKQLVITPVANPTTAANSQKKAKRIYGRTKKIVLVDDNQDLEQLPPSLPHDLKEFCTWANSNLTGGKTKNTIFLCDLFGHPKKATIYRSDVYDIANGKVVSNGVILFYMSYMHGLLKKNLMENMFQFIDCDLVGAIGSGTPTSRSRDLSVMYNKGKPGQIFLIPYNTGNHWTLTIVNPTMETARYMDPLKRHLDGSERPSIVTDSLKMFKASTKSTGKKKASP